MSYENLPSHIVSEILSRTTSLLTLDNSKSVCKSWNHIIHDPKFMSFTSNYLSGYIIQHRKKHNFFSKFVSMDQSPLSSEVYIPNNMRVLASCKQGILCCLRRKDSKQYQYYVSKPATNQWKAIPNPRLRFKTVAIAIMVLSSSPLRFKVVRLSDRGKVGSITKYKCEIFHSKTWKWEETNEDITLPFYEKICSSNKAILTSNDSIHWRTSHDTVLSFHEPQGTFQKLPLPQEIIQDKQKYSFKYKQLVEYKGRLGLVCNTNEGYTELWVMYENPINNWRKKMAMDIGSVLRSKAMPNADVACFYSDKIMVLNAFDEIVFYDLESGELSRVDTVNNASEIFKFQSDLEIVNFGIDRSADHLDVSVPCWFLQ